MKDYRALRLDALLERGIITIEDLLGNASGKRLKEVEREGL